MTNSNKGKITYGATLNLPASVGGGCFTLSPSWVFDNPDDAFVYAMNIRRETGYDCSPTATLYNPDGRLSQYIIYGIIVVTADGKPDDTELHYWQLPLLYISYDEVMAMSLEERRALLRAHKAANYRGLYIGEDLFPLPF